MKFRIAAAALALSLAVPFTASADTPANGIGGIAVSPDGKTVLAAGDTRVVYVLDAATMEVKDRVYTGTTVVWMTYRQDGKVVFARDTSGVLTAVDTSTFKPVWQLKGTQTADYALAANLLAVTVRKKYNEYLARTIDANTFETKSETALPVKFYPRGQGISIDGLKMVVTSSSRRVKDEERKRPPSDMRGLERNVFRHKHDQYGSQIAQIDLTTGQTEITDSWWYSSRPKHIHVTMGGATVLGYTSDNATIAPSGEVTMIDAGSRSQYSAMTMPAGDAYVIGAMRQISLKKAGSDSAQVFKLKRMAGWPEYVLRFTTGPNGKIYASTNAYRVIVLDPAAGTIKAHAVY